MVRRKLSLRGQVSIFVIIAVVIVAGAVLFFALRDKIAGVQIPASLDPVYKNFLVCLEENTLTGIDVLESQGGYIEMPDFVAGSSYMPFSSQLNFLGNPVPYWYYVSGNNIQKEQVPTISNMEDELNNFIENKIKNCVYDAYYNQGFEIVQQNPRADVQIEDDKVLVNLKMDLSISKGEDNAVISSHNIEVNSELGGLYKDAVKVYNQEQSTLFLENYAVDIMRLYAPVDGVELTCSPKIWNAEKIFDSLKDAIEVNTLSLRSKTGDYGLVDPANKYFVLDLGVNRNIRFLNSKIWSSTFEVVPTDGPVMMFNPVGNQPGLGILGFCYVPYHFVYNMKYPVMIQLYSANSDEIFQFPMAVIIQGNLPRNSGNINTAEESPREFCKDKNSLMQVNLYDNFFNSVDANVSYSCFGEVCEMGETSAGILETEFPQCVNGVIITKADGFLDSRTIVSSVASGTSDIILDKIYEQEISLNLDGKPYSGEAIISFSSDKVSKTVLYPEQNKVKLAEGQYTIRVDIYKNSSLKLEKTIKQQCYDVPRSGLGGLFGLKEEKCVSMEIPEQIISNALSGGGIQEHYIAESELRDNTKIEINAESLKIPKSLEDLQDNYVIFESQKLEVNFK